MRHKRNFFSLPKSLACWLILPCLLLACGESQESARLVVEPPAEVVKGPISPLPRTIALNPDEVQLGRLLFHDKRLSADDSIACAHCHPLSRYGVDGLPVSVGVGGQLGVANAPSVFNSAFNFRQFWDGRAASLEAQIDGPLNNPFEMGSSWSQVLGKLGGDAKLQALSSKVYGRALDEHAIRQAIARFQQSLITPDAPFDRFLRGETEALNEQAQAGWRLFRELGCVACHQGVNVGGNMYASLGVMGDYFGDRPIRPSDLGLYQLTGRDEDRFKFKVPSLRNVAMTAPYFHDGQVATLEEAVERMAQLQLGLKLKPQERDEIVAFLESLTAALPEGLE